MRTKSGILFLGRQPIVDVKSDVLGYELLYRNSDLTSSMKSEHAATASVLTHTLSLSGIENVVGKHLAFVNIDSSFLLHDMILSLPKEKLILEIDTNILNKEQSLARLEKLYLKGFSFTLSLNSIDDESIKVAKSILKYITYIKLNTIELDLLKLSKTLLTLGANRKRLIATHIETQESFNTFKEIGFEFFQGYFFSKPEIIESTQLSVEATNVINLCNLLATDTDTKELCEAFSHSPLMVIQLIQYLNSSLFSLKSNIDSVEKIITLLGRKKLQQWLYLTLYAAGENPSEDNAMLLTIKQRTQLLVDLLRTINPEVGKDKLAQAYFVGLLSGMDVVFKRPLKTILDAMQLDEEIKDAILDFKGPLGELYEVSLAIEKFDLDKTEKFIKKHNIEPLDFQKFLFRSFENLNDFKFSA